MSEYQIDSMVTITGSEYVHLRSEVERLRAALREIEKVGKFVAQALGPRNILMEICEIARAALGGGDEE